MTEIERILNAKEKIKKNFLSNLNLIFKKFLSNFFLVYYEFKEFKKKKKRLSSWDCSQLVQNLHGKIKTT